MTMEDIRNLDCPGAGNFDEKRLAAIEYTRNWAINRGEVKNGEIIVAFEKHYSADERETIRALIQIMDFANRFNNTWFKPLDRRKVFGAG